MGMMDKFGYGTPQPEGRMPSEEEEMLSKMTSHEAGREAVTKIRRYFGRSFGSPLSKAVLSHFIETGENLTDYDQETMMARLQQLRQGNSSTPIGMAAPPPGTAGFRGGQ